MCTLIDRCESDTSSSADVTFTDDPRWIALFSMSHAELCPQDDPLECVGTYTLTQADVDSGTRTNTADVTSTSPDGTTATDSHENTMDILGSATVTIGEACIQCTFCPLSMISCTVCWFVVGEPRLNPGSRRSSHSSHTGGRLLVGL